MSQDTITIVEPNGVERTRPLPPHDVTIGRGGDATLSLAYDLVSRYHARITCEDGAYYVTDLDSANGTYLGSTRLAPHNPTYWRPDQPLRVGEVIINLQQVSRPAAVIESAETMLGHFADETPMKQAGLKPAQHKTWPMWLAALAAALCALAAAGTGAYYWLAG